MKQIFLSGGGSGEDSLLLDRLFVKALNPNEPLVYIPVAKNSNTFLSCLDWFNSMFNPLGITNVHMKTDLSAHLPEKPDSTGIYVGGGNTVKLLEEMRDSKFDICLLKLIEQGLPFYGGSAGAIILGETILTAPEAEHLDKETARGLNIINGFSVYCHYNLSDDLGPLCKRLKTKIIAISERSGVHIEGDTLEVVGYDSVKVFDGSKTVVLQPTTKVNLESVI